jgi:hypothetical protein
MSSLDWTTTQKSQREKQYSHAANRARKNLPIIAFEEYRDDPITDLRPLFSGTGGIVISSELAEPLLRFDLGRTLVLPLRILKYDRKTEIFSDRVYHIILRYEVFEALAPDASTNLRPSGVASPPKRWNLPRPVNDDDIAVTEAALDGPAIWWDPALHTTRFFNGEVVAAMHENDTAKYWHLKQCRVEG